MNLEENMKTALLKLLTRFLYILSIILYIFALPFLFLDTFVAMFEEKDK